MSTTLVPKPCMSFQHVLFLTLLTMAGNFIIHDTRVSAADPDPLQDFCVADLSAASPSVNGYPCKAASLATIEDFTYSGLAKPANLTGKPLNGTATPASVSEWPALNTLGLSFARLDLNPGGVGTPHTHPLASEILIGQEGEIYCGFVTTSDNVDVPNKVFAAVVKKGEAIVIPRGLLHFQINKGSTRASSFSVFNGQNPGVQRIPLALFGSGIDPELLAKAFFISESEVAQLVNTFTTVH